MADRTRYTANLVSDNNLYVDITTDRVGIGTTIPTSKLTVYGDTYITGILTATAFVGDGSGLTGLTGIESSGIGIGTTSTSIIGTGVTSLIFSGDAISSVNISSSIATINIEKGQTRSTTSIATTSIATNQDGIGTVSLPKSAILLSIQSTTAGWFRVYNRSDNATIDASRLRTVDPEPSSGVLIETISIGNETIILTPPSTIINMESPATNVYPYRFTNDGAPGSATITLTYLILEA